MPVVAFKVAHEPHPVLVTVFCVQTYWRDRLKLARGKVEQFANVESALRAGKRASLRAPAVVVSRYRGNVEADYWEEPVVVARYGEKLQCCPLTIATTHPP